MQINAPAEDILDYSISGLDRALSPVQTSSLSASKDSTKVRTGNWSGNVELVSGFGFLNWKEITFDSSHLRETGTLNLLYDSPTFQFNTSLGSRYEKNFTTKERLILNSSFFGGMYSDESSDSKSGFINAGASITLRDSTLAGVSSLLAEGGIRLRGNRLLDHYSGAILVGEDVWRDSVRLRENFNYLELYAEPNVRLSYHKKDYGADLHTTIQLYGNHLTDKDKKDKVNWRPPSTIGNFQFFWNPAPAHRLAVVGSRSALTHTSDEIEHFFQTEIIDGRPYTVFQWDNTAYGDSFNHISGLYWNGKVLTSSLLADYLQERRHKYGSGDKIKDSHRWIIRASVGVHPGQEKSRHLLF